MQQNKHVLERIIRLDGSLMTDRAATHSYLRARLNFPDYYGENLDALYDLLTEIGEPTRIIFYRVDVLKYSQPDYGRSLLKVFRAADDANPMLTVVFMEGESSVKRQYKIKLAREEASFPDWPVE